MARSFTANFAAALSGQFGRALISLVAVPLYLPLLGREAFGLVGFHGALMAVLSLIDGGLGVAANREVARRQSDQSPENGIRVFVRTLEWVYWVIGILLALLCLGLSGWLARVWLTPKELSVELTAQCLAALGAGVALRWPAALYNGVLVGSQRLVFLNAVSLAVGIGYGLGGYLVLRFVNNSPLAFFQWQLLLSTAEVAVLAFYTWKILPRLARPARFDGKELRGIRDFALGNGLLALCTIGLTSSDRIILGKILPLQSLGHYSIATQINGVVSRMGSVFYSLYLPRFSRLTTQTDRSPLLGEFQKGVQLVSVLVFPVYGLIILLMPDLLRWWLRDAEMAAAASAAARWLVVGSAFNAVMMVHHTLLLSLGITSFAIRQNIVALVLYLPLLYALIIRFGIEGAAMSWAALNIGYFLITPPLMLKRVSAGLPRALVYRLTAPALGLSLIVFIFGMLFFRSNALLHAGVCLLLTGGIMAGLAASTPWIRRYAEDLARGRKATAS